MSNVSASCLKYYLKIATRLLTGGYTNFGVFSVYGDDCYAKLIASCFDMIQLINRSSMHTLIKMSEYVYETYEILTKDHIRQWIGRREYYE